MGMDLFILPFDCDLEGSCFSHTILNCRCDYELFDRLKEIETMHGEKVPRDFTSFLSLDGEYEEKHYGYTQQTPYGEVLKFVMAKYLKHIHSDMTRNETILNYIRSLDDTNKIALYWN